MNIQITRSRGPSPVHCLFCNESFAPDQLYLNVSVDGVVWAHHIDCLPWTDFQFYDNVYDDHEDHNDDDDDLPPLQLQRQDAMLPDDGGDKDGHEHKHLDFHTGGAVSSFASSCASSVSRFYTTCSHNVMSEAMPNCESCGTINMLN